MLQPLSSSVTAMPSSSPSSKPRRLPNPNPNPSSSSIPPCNHSPSATLDLLILILVLFSCTFLITSSLSHLFRSLSQILPSLLQPLYDAPLPYLAGLLIFLTVTVLAAVFCHRMWLWSRRCDNPRCKGLKNAMEFDVQLQTEEGLKSPDAVWKEIDDLPWKGGEQGNNPDYECLRAELRRMAPPNGRAVLLFRAPCGCPLAKLEGWGQKRGRKHKKGMASLALEGGGNR